MRFGLIGLGNSGKTTVFNALTGSSVETGVFSDSSFSINKVVIEIPDERVDFLTEFYKPKKTVYATLEITDFAGIPENFSQSGSLDGNFLSLVKTLDSIGIVIRNFNDDIINAAQGLPDPVGDFNRLYSEIILSDLLIAESRLEKIELAYKRGLKKQETINEENVLRKVAKALSDQIKVKDVDLSQEELKILKGFQFLTLKPIVIILNSDENNFQENQDLVDNLKTYGNEVIEFAGKFEMELNFLSEDEAQVFMKELSIHESARKRIINLVFRVMGLIVFFTVGSDEVRAWTVEDQENIVDSAGKIHTDLARGFIRAEVFRYDDLKECKTEKSIKDKGLFRLEGKKYSVNDGDIICVRFSV